MDFDDQYENKINLFAQTEWYKINTFHKEKITKENNSKEPKFLVTIFTIPAKRPFGMNCWHLLIVLKIVRI